MPTPISHLDTDAPRLGVGGTPLSLVSSRPSVVQRSSALTFSAAPTGTPVGRQALDLDAFVSAPLDDLVAELQRIHGAADCADAYVFPA